MVSNVRSDCVLPANCEKIVANVVLPENNKFFRNRRKSGAAS
jgi:hypothetical protein